MNEYQALRAIAELRRSAADVVALCDVVILGAGYDVRRALTALPDRTQTLMFRIQRALTTLEDGATAHMPPTGADDPVR
jgi:hypothetical protein